jgi:hypothetical protein
MIEETARHTGHADLIREVRQKSFPTSFCAHVDDADMVAERQETFGIPDCTIVTLRARARGPQQELGIRASVLSTHRDSTRPSGGRGQGIRRAKFLLRSAAED